MGEVLLALGRAREQLEELEGSVAVAPRLGQGVLPGTAALEDLEHVGHFRIAHLPIVWAMQHAPSEPDRQRLADIYRDGEGATDGRGPTTQTNRPVSEWLGVTFRNEA